MKYVGFALSITCISTYLKEGFVTIKHSQKGISCIRVTDVYVELSDATLILHNYKSVS